MAGKARTGGSRGRQRSADSLKQWERKAFVVMPFDDRGHRMLKNVIKPVLLEHKIKAVIAPEVGTDSDGMKKIYEGIWFSRFVVVNLNGLRANVLEELGIAVALNKQVIGILEGKKDLDLPFNLGRDVVITYRTSAAGRDKLKVDLANRVKQILRESWFTMPTWKGKDAVATLPTSALVAREAQIQQEAWIIQPDEKFEDRAFREVVLSNLERGITYRFIVTDGPRTRASFKRSLGRHYGKGAVVKYVKRDALPLPSGIALFDPLDGDGCGYQYFPNGITAMGVPLAPTTFKLTEELFIAIWNGPYGEIVGNATRLAA